MIKYLEKTVFNSGCEALVNPINCKGVMGKGLALEFALRYPQMEKAYIEDCKNNKVKLGQILTYKMDDILIVNFPTKDHFKYPSKIEWIKEGLIYLKNHYHLWQIKSIAIPPLGCSNGGLDYLHQVKPLIEDILKDVDLDIYICLDTNKAEGTELKMLDAFNNSNREYLCEYLEISGKAKLSITTHQKINRFF